MKTIPATSLLLLSACMTITPNTTVGIPNPASVYCIEQGGQVNLQTDEQGNQYGICKLPNGQNIDEWTLYRQSISTKASHNSTLKHITDETNQVFIIFYNPNQQTKVMHAITEQQGEILYDYQDFSGLVIKTPHLHQAKESLSQLKEVYQVQFNKTNQINN